MIIDRFGFCVDSARFSTVTLTNTDLLFSLIECNHTSSSALMLIFGVKHTFGIPFLLLERSRLAAVRHFFDYGVFKKLSRVARG
jgi:hypothetical protein